MLYLELLAPRALKTIALISRRRRHSRHSWHMNESVFVIQTDEKGSCRVCHRRKHGNFCSSLRVARPRVCLDTPSCALRPGSSGPDTLLSFRPHEVGMVTKLANLHGTRSNGSHPGTRGRAGQNGYASKAQVRLGTKSSNRLRRSRR